jgi:hypothetical protein
VQNTKDKLVQLTFSTTFLIVNITRICVFRWQMWNIHLESFFWTNLAMWNEGMCSSRMSCKPKVFGIDMTGILIWTLKSYRLSFLQILPMQNQSSLKFNELSPNQMNFYLSQNNFYRVFVTTWENISRKIDINCLLEVNVLDNH